jgi:hypothetical protein
MRQGRWSSIWISGQTPTPVIIAMRLVQIDGIGLQALQGGLDCLLDIAPGEAACRGVTPHRKAQFGGEDDAVPVLAAPHPTSQDAFGCVLPVDIGRIDPIPSAVKVGIQHSK